MIAISYLGLPLQLKPCRMKIGGHVRFFCVSACRVWLVFNAKYVENLRFLHVERGLTISKAFDANLGMCGLAAVPLFWSDTSREGPGGGGKSAYFVLKILENS